ncbi:dihydropteroate synthase [Pseudemcibacter aquimaris]|uniref:dihydropteroate synthase n=1 Tax=Pseudemcibacter aquimaris TaxID=2857064 RepID=UPI0020130467|nr:dihydropteroate synthase [Pseudemcibacter aquimaris]MCC3862192.1 dihydropteroate synthase [Pseudemcibacter aquimaris]WDU58945.1 dihydropteroate synthase [Pseudemcibacter aquimaris]
MDDVSMEILGSDLRCFAVRIITKSAGEISSETIPVNSLGVYLSTLDDDKKAKLWTLIDNIAAKRSNILNLDFQDTIIQGVLNVTPDSFSDGGKFADPNSAIKQAQEMIDAGCDILDIGGESTKPGAEPVSIDEELNRVIPVIQKISDLKINVSIDSRNADVMEAAVKEGAHIINDVSAIEHDPKAIEVLKETDVPVILMHAQGTPENMQDNPNYQNAVLEIYDYLESRIEFCVANGIDKNRIIIDPGIGFGKTVDHNIELIKHVAIFHGLGVPILIGVSRKSFIGKISGEEIAANRLPGSLSAAQYCVQNGVQVVRVHDVPETVQAISVFKKIRHIKDNF